MHQVLLTLCMLPMLLVCPHCIILDPIADLKISYPGLPAAIKRVEALDARLGAGPVQQITTAVCKPAMLPVSVLRLQKGSICAIQKPDPPAPMSPKGCTWCHFCALIAAHAVHAMLTDKDALNTPPVHTVSTRDVASYQSAMLCASRAEALCML